MGSRFCRVLLVCLLAAPPLALAPASAPAKVLDVDNPRFHSFAGFAETMAMIGDVNGDGASDFLVGSYNDPVEAHVRFGLERLRSAAEMKVVREGRAFVFSGTGGELLYTVDSPKSPEVEAARYSRFGLGFGCAVAALGDVSRDGTPDFAVGAFSHSRSGRVFIFSGRDGSLLATLTDPTLPEEAAFGWALASLDAGRGGAAANTIAVGAPGVDKVIVFSAEGAKRLFAVGNPAGPGAFGWALDRAGDVNGDGVSDLIVGAPYQDLGGKGSSGRVVPQRAGSLGAAPEKAAEEHRRNRVHGQAFVFSGANGNPLLTLDDPTPTPGAALGWVVAGPGDVNKDGTPDLLVSAPYRDAEQVRSQGAVFLFSGKDGSLLYALATPNPHSFSIFGLFAAGAGDVNGDDAPEIVVGAPYQTVDLYSLQGQLFVYNGRDGRHLFTFDDPYPQQGALFGSAALVPGDLDGDAVPEFIIGAPGQSLDGKPAVGRIFIFTSKP